MTTSKISLKETIAPAFYDVHKSIKNNEFVHYFLKGGRGSTKSSFISIEIIFGIMNSNNSNCVCFRKYATDLKDSVYNQLLWAINILGVSNYWQENLSPLRLTYLPTGQQIIFRGVDDASKSKSIKPKSGFFKYIWFEEADQFFGMEEIRKLNQSLLRGGENQCVFYTYNPPKSVRNWINSEVLFKSEDRLVHHSTYLDVPKNWLGKQFFIEAENLKNRNETSYKHEYLGEITGSGGEVFNNITIREISDEEINCFERIYRGLDFGYSIDPCAYICVSLIKKRLYIFYEFYKPGVGFLNLSKEIKKENKENYLVYADSAEPRSIFELLSLGIKVTGVKKFRGSVNFGITYLKELEEIIIDPKRCPNTAREFSTYENQKDKNGNFFAEFPDKNNHSIDAVRYALSNYTIPLKKEEKKKHSDFKIFEKKSNNKISEYLGF